MKLSVQDLVLSPCFVYRHLQRIQNLITHSKSLGVCQGFFLSDTGRLPRCFAPRNDTKSAAFVCGGKTTLQCNRRNQHQFAEISLHLRDFMV